MDSRIRLADFISGNECGEPACSMIASYICERDRLLLCTECKELKYHSEVMCKFVQPSITKKNLENVINLLAFIRQDSEKLDIDIKFDGFFDEIEIFENRSKTLISNVQKQIESVINTAINRPNDKYRYLQELSDENENATTLKEELLRSQMFLIYSKSVAERYLAIALIDPSKQYVSVKYLAKELEERLSIAISMTEESKQNEINKYKKELEEQKEAFINEIETDTENQIRTVNLECLDKAQEAMMLVEKYHNDGQPDEEIPLLLWDLDQQEPINQNRNNLKQHYNHLNSINKIKAQTRYFSNYINKFRERIPGNIKNKNRNIWILIGIVILIVVALLVSLFWFVILKNDGRLDKCEQKLDLISKENQGNIALVKNLTQKSKDMDEQLSKLLVKVENLCTSTTKLEDKNEGLDTKSNDKASNDMSLSYAEKIDKIYKLTSKTITSLQKDLKSKNDKMDELQENLKSKNDQIDELKKKLESVDESSKNKSQADFFDSKIILIFILVLSVFLLN